MRRHSRACGIRLGSLINKQKKRSSDFQTTFNKEIEKIKWDGDVAVQQHRYASQAEDACIDFFGYLQLVKQKRRKRLFCYLLPSDIVQKLP